MFPKSGCVGGGAAAPTCKLSICKQSRNAGQPPWPGWSGRGGRGGRRLDGRCMGLVEITPIRIHRPDNLSGGQRFPGNLQFFGKGCFQDVSCFCVRFRLSSCPDPGPAVSLSRPPCVLIAATALCPILVASHRSDLRSSLQSWQIYLLWAKAANFFLKSEKDMSMAEWNASHFFRDLVKDCRDFQYSLALPTNSF